MKMQLLTLLIATSCFAASAQTVPLDTATWEIDAQGYLIESYKGRDAIYLQSGSITLKDFEFRNGTIEYKINLKKTPAFPGVYFRAQENGDAEQFYIRPHQSGNPDANQAVPTTKNITPWQLYHGSKYSFPYEYKFDTWTQVQIRVLGNRAQVFLDGSETPHLSWNTFHEPKAGTIILTGGNRAGLHIADVSISTEDPQILDFNPIEKEPIEGIISEWSVSDKFSENQLADVENLAASIAVLKWVGRIQAEEGTAANFSRIHNRFDGSDQNTAIAKVTINSANDQVKLFEFGYSDRALVLLNGKPVYKGTNRFRSRDYRYLGTVGLFDAVYLDLKKGKNELLIAVSEDFGGWLVTGRFQDQSGLKIK